MSWYNTVVLSFSSGEFDGEKPPANFGPLRKINSWLRQHKFDSLADLSGGKLGSNAVLFGGCYNYLDIGEFVVLVLKQKWDYPEDVQILFWGDNDSKFSVILGASAPTRKSKASKRRSAARTPKSRK